MRNVEIDEELYQWLQRRALPFEDTPNSVLRRLAGLNEPLSEEGRKFLSRPGLVDLTPPFAFWKPILVALFHRTFTGNRAQILDDVEKAMEGKLSDYDKGEASPGVIRWRNTAELAALELRAEGLLEPASEANPEEWTLTQDGITAVYVL